MRFHHRTIIAVSMLGSLGLSSALAAAHVRTLRTALGHIPEAVLSTEDAMPVVYLDVKAMSKAEAGALSESALRRLSLARQIRPLDSLMYGMGATWTEKAGIAFEDISYFAAVGQPPARTSYWGLADAATATALLDTLAARRFTEFSAAPRILANGEPRAISLTARDPENPWLGPLGQSSFVFTRGEAVVQSSAPEDFKPITAMTRSVNDNPAVATALDGLAEAPLANDASIVQALVITPLFGLSALDASDLLLDGPADLEATRKKTEASLTRSTMGIPPYLAGIITDAQLPKGPALLVSLAYADCATAEKSVSAMQARWTKTMDLPKILTMSGQAVPTKTGTCAAVVSFSAKGQVNQPLFDVYNRYMKRDFNFLQIGDPQ